MNAFETKQRIFEPFYETKKVGEPVSLTRELFTASSNSTKCYQPKRNSDKQHLIFILPTPDQSTEEDEPLKYSRCLPAAAKQFWWRKTN